MEDSGKNMFLEKGTRFSSSFQIRDMILTLSYLLQVCCAQNEDCEANNISNAIGKLIKAVRFPQMSIRELLDVGLLLHYGWPLQALSIFA